MSAVDLKWWNVRYEYVNIESHITQHLIFFSIYLMKTAIETFSRMEYLSRAKWYTWKGNFYSWLSISHQEYVMAFLCPFYSTLSNIQYWYIVFYKKLSCLIAYPLLCSRRQSQLEICYRSYYADLFYVMKMLL